MKAYRWRPGMTFTVTVHGPFAPKRVSGAAVLSHSLKSPTIETFLAPAASKVISTGTARTAPAMLAAGIAVTLTGFGRAASSAPSGWPSVCSEPRATNPIASAAAASKPADVTEKVEIGRAHV